MPTSPRRRWPTTALILLALGGCTAAPGDAPGPPPPSSATPPSPGWLSPGQLSSGQPSPGWLSSGQPSPAVPSPSSVVPTASRRTPAPTAPRDRAELVSVTRSGGFAGLTDTVAVRADGTWTRTNRRTADRSGRLTAPQLSRLRTLAADPALSTEGVAGRPPTCADAFTYTVVTPNHRIRYEDCPGQTRPTATLTLATFVLEATTP